MERVLLLNEKKSLLFVLFIIFGIGISSTFAYFTESNSLANNFETGNPVFRIEQTVDFSVPFPGDGDESLIDSNYNLDNDVYVRNYGTADLFVRVGPTVMTYFNEHVYREFTNTDYSSYATPYLYNSYDDLCIKMIIEDSEKDYWIEHDGWYYLTKVLKGNSEIYKPDDSGLYNPDIPVNTVKLFDYYSLSGMDAGTLFKVDYSAEAVQVLEEAVNDVWGHNVVVSESGDITWNFLN